MGKYRTVITYKNFFEDFLDKQSPKVQSKILQILRVIEEIEIIPSSYLRYIEGTDGLFEVRVIFSTNIFRIFCFFDEGKLVILLNGLQKKTEKTPKNEIVRANRLKAEYFIEKQGKKQL